MNNNSIPDGVTYNHASTGTAASHNLGAMCLLKECVELQRGETLLLVREEPGLNFYDDAVPEHVEESARAMGAQVEVLVAGDLAEFQQEPDKFLQQLKGFDHVVFFSRIGDQIRFRKNDLLPDITMVYTLGSETLESTFGTACYRGMLEIKRAIDIAFFTADQVTVTCPLGTSLQGTPQWPIGENHDVSIKRFPMLVPTPVPANGFSGKVVISRFLIGTGSHDYSPYSLLIDEDIEAVVENNRITGFNGPPQICEQIKKHYDHVSSLFDIDAYFIHSWHAGIHPGCSYTESAFDNLTRWSGSAFGNPRLLHVHTCGGYAPGEISWNIKDPTICVDGIKLWEAGKLHPARLESCREIFKDHPRLEALFNNPVTSIGL